MSRRCMVTGKGVMSGNNVSHAMNKTRRTFEPNIQDVNLYSEALQRRVKLRVSMHGLRTVEHRGGLDRWLLSVAPSKIHPDLRSVRAQVKEALAEKKKA